MHCPHVLRQPRPAWGHGDVMPAMRARLIAPAIAAGALSFATNTPTFSSWWPPARRVWQGLIQPSRRHRPRGSCRCNAIGDLSTRTGLAGEGGLRRPRSLSLLESWLRPARLPGVAADLAAHPGGPGRARGAVESVRSAVASVRGGAGSAAGSFISSSSSVTYRNTTPRPSPSRPPCRPSG